MTGGPSKELRSALRSRDDFIQWLRGWGAWSRRDPDRPHAYRCSLGAHQIDEEEDPRDDARFLEVSDADAMIIDRAVALVEEGSRATKLYVRWVYVLNNDFASVLVCANDLYRAMRRERQEFTMLGLMGFQDRLADRVRKIIYYRFDTSGRPLTE